MTKCFSITPKETQQQTKGFHFGPRNMSQVPFERPALLAHRPFRGSDFSEGRRRLFFLTASGQRQSFTEWRGSSVQLARHWLGEAVSLLRGRRCCFAAVVAGNCPTCLRHLWLALGSSRGARRGSRPGGDTARLYTTCWEDSCMLIAQSQPGQEDSL